jgi:hypothetical protein
MTTFKARMIALLVPFVALFALSAAPALASPWWSLTSSSRPTYLQSGQAKDEVEQIRVSATEGTAILEGETRRFRLAVGEEPQEVQEALEQRLYGPGNVQVREAPSVEHLNAHEVYEVTFVGELADDEITPFSVTSTELVGGQKEVLVKEIQKARGEDGAVVVTATNVGDTPVDPEAHPVTVTDQLPRGLQAVAVEANDNESVLGGDSTRQVSCSVVPGSEARSVTCTYNGVENAFKLLVPFNQIQVRIAVDVQSGAHTGEVNEADISGGEAPADSVRRPLVFSDSPVPYGVNSYELRAEEEGGKLDTRAGSHPFQLTTTIQLNETFEGGALNEQTHHELLSQAKPAALTKDLSFKLPPGLIGDPALLPQCTLAQFNTNIGAGSECPPQTAVGVADVRVNIPGLTHDNIGLVQGAVYNIEPAAGEPARFGFLVENSPVLIDTAVRTGGDYGVTVSVTNVSQFVGLGGSVVTFWGVPGDPAHNAQRGDFCRAHQEAIALGTVGGNCSFESSHPPPFLSLPTSCPADPLTHQPEPLLTSMEADSWAEPHTIQTLGSTEPLQALDSCNQLPFTPSIKVTPDGTAGSTPTGLNVDVHVAQNSILDAESPAESAVKEITVALPEGVAINPAGGDGLEACSEGLVGFTGFGELETVPRTDTALFTPRVPGGTAATVAGEGTPLQPGLNFCGDASKIGTVQITSPLLPKGQALKGAVYLAAQNANPFGSLVAIYIVAEDPVSGTVVKQTGEVHITPSGQLVTTLKGVPQLAFEDAELHFFGGERAPLTSPTYCGAYATTASFTPWSGNEPVAGSSSFNITSGPHGSPCVYPGQALPFSPSLTSGATNINAGAFSQLTTTIGREDGQQDMQFVTLHYPAGLSGILANVALCGNGEADAGTCSAASQIGETTVAAGVGSDPVNVKGGKVFITGPYNGTGSCTAGTAGCAPFGLSIVNPVKAGPFDLEHDTSNPSQTPACDCVVVRAKIEVDPLTAALTITTDPSGPYAIPHLIDGIPVQIKKVNVLVNRPGFTFNPTDCSPFSVTGNISSDEGASSPVSVPFQATNCAILKFAPKFSVSTSGKTSKAQGASLTATLSEPAGAMGTQSNITRVKVDLPKQLPSRLTTLQKACTNAQFEANPAACPAASKIGMATVSTPLLPVPLSGPAIFVSHGGEAFPSLTMVLQGYGVTVDLVGTTFISKAGVTSTTFKTVPDVPFNTFTLTLPQGKYSALAANGNLCTSKLTMPTEFLAQNGAKINQSTPVGVTGCAKHRTLTRAQKLAAALKVCRRKEGRKRSGCEKAARKRYGLLKKAKAERKVSRSRH